MSLGTDGFGRSDTREKLRDFFEISKEFIVIHALRELELKNELRRFIKENEIEISKVPPWKK